MSLALGHARGGPRRLTSRHRNDHGAHGYVLPNDLPHRRILYVCRLVGPSHNGSQRGLAKDRIGRTHDARGLCFRCSGRIDDKLDVGTVARSTCRDVWLKIRIRAIYKLGAVCDRAVAIHGTAPQEGTIGGREGAGSRGTCSRRTRAGRDACGECDDDVRSPVHLSSRRWHDGTRFRRLEIQ